MVVLKVGFGILGLVLLLGCVTAPPVALQSPPAGIVVVSFAIQRDVRLFNLNGPVEARPGLIGMGGDGFETPVFQAVTGAWARFPQAAAKAFGGLEWRGPGNAADHPAWVETSSESIATASLDYRKARGYLWPEEFRFVDSDSAALGPVAQEYPGHYLLTVEYTMAAEDVGDATEFRYPDFRVALYAVFTVYGSDGSRLSRVAVTGRSTTQVPRKGVAVDRRRLPDLMLEAQEDALTRWSRLVKFELSQNG